MNALSAEWSNPTITRANLETALRRAIRDQGFSTAPLNILSSAGGFSTAPSSAASHGPHANASPAAVPDHFYARSVPAPQRQAGPMVVE